MCSRAWEGLREWPNKEVRAYVRNYVRKSFKNWRSDVWENCHTDVLIVLVETRKGSFDNIPIKGTVEHEELIKAVRAIKEKYRRSGQKKVEFLADVEQPEKPRSIELAEAMAGRVLDLHGDYLQPEQRQVLQFRVRGAEYKDIAAAMDISAARARKLYELAVRKLRSRVSRMERQEFKELYDG